MPYSKIHPDDMILRDHLAYDRTVLANERTFLSYARTSITLLIAGGTLIKFLHEDLSMLCLGTVVSGVGGTVFLFGIRRYVTIKKRLSATYEDPAIASGN